MKRILIFLVLISVLPFLFGQRRWKAKGIPVSTRFHFAEKHLLAPDGKGGAIVAWMDKGSRGYGLYAQRLSRGGERLWGDGDVGVFTGSPVGESFAMIADGAGGVIVAWQDSRSGNSDIYSQRLSASGKKMWGSTGKPVCLESHGQTQPVLAADGSGGVVVAWQDFRLDSSSDIFAQRLDAGGNPCWTADGVPVCTTANPSRSLAAVSNGAGGAIFLWEDYRSGADANIYAQQVSGAGGVTWPGNGVPVCADAAMQSLPKSIPDESGGAIVIWSDNRNGFSELFCQRIDSTGDDLWASDGIPLASRSNSQYEAVISPDESGGAVIAWMEELVPSSTYHDVYAQRVDAAGNPLWTTAGVPVCVSAGDQRVPAIAADRSGGAFISWADGRALGSNWKVYASHLDAGGAARWDENGIRVSLNDHDQGQPRMIPDDRGGVIAVWRDFDSAVSSIYAQRLSPVISVNFIAGEGGKIIGDSSQRIYAGGSCTEVEAMHVKGYRFHCWTGTGGFHSTENPLRVRNVSEDMIIQANFMIKSVFCDSDSP